MMNPRTTKQRVAEVAAWMLLALAVSGSVHGLILAAYYYWN